MSHEIYDEAHGANDFSASAIELIAGEPLTPERLAEATGARAALVLRLVRLGVLEAVSGASGQTLLPAASVLHMRRMLRLRRDLGVNFAGAHVIIELIEQIEELKRVRRAPGVDPAEDDD